MTRFFAPFPYWHFVPTPGEYKYRAALKVLKDAIDVSISEHEAAAAAGKTNEAEADILSFMLQEDASGAKPRREDIQRQLLTFLFAGHDTTANMLCWMVYYLCRHPAYMAEAEAEVATVTNGSRLNTEHVKQLRFLGCVAKEALRLRPSAPARGRIAVRDTTLCGQRIPRGTFVTWSAYVVHRDPKVWANPERFDPHRFDTGAPKIHPFGFIPFGGGPRRCIGEQLACVGRGRVRCLGCLLTVEMVCQHVNQVR